MPCQWYNPAPLVTHKQEVTIKKINSPLSCPEFFDNKPSPMPCAKAGACLREEPTPGGGGVSLIATRLRHISSSADGEDDMGEEAKEAGNIVVKRW